MSRRICVEMYNAIIKLRPEWASGPNDDDNGKSCVAKIVMTGSAEDGPDWQQHIRNKEKRRKLAARFKDSKRPIQDRDRARHVADRFRRAIAQHDVCRQADARSRPHASHRARESRFPRQARRPWSSITSGSPINSSTRSRLTRRAAAKVVRASTRRQQSQSCWRNTRSRAA